MPFTILADVTPERVSWLWPGRIPFGKITILDGDPGLGKSTVMLDLAARLSTRRELPGGGLHEPLGTIVMMLEDGLADTVAPRLINAGADMTRIGALGTVTDEQGRERVPVFPECLADIENVMPVVGARLLIVDPIFNYLGENNAHRDQDVRNALTPLAYFAEQTGLAVVLLRHLNKAAAIDALYRGQGSIGFIGIARSGLIGAKDPDDPERKLIASSKSNLGPTPPTLAYRLTGCDNGAARVDWDGVSSHTAQTMVQQDRDHDGGALGEAVRFLEEALADGPALGRIVKQRARDHDISEATLRRAREQLKVIWEKAKTQDGAYTWALPPKEGEVAQLPPQHRNMNNIEQHRLESDVDHIVHVDHVVRVGAGLSNLPLAATSGRGFVCAVCGRPIFAIEGRPLLCREHGELLPSAD
jgi:hypothetical protein